MLIALPLVAPAAGGAGATAATAVVAAVVAAGAAGADRAASTAIASAAGTAKVMWGRPRMDSFYARRRAMALGHAMGSGSVSRCSPLGEGPKSTAPHSLGPSPD